MESRLPWVISVGVVILSALGYFCADSALGQMGDLQAKPEGVTF